MLMMSLTLTLYPRVDNTDSRFSPQEPHVDIYNRPPSLSYGGPLQTPQAFIDSTGKKVQVFVDLIYFSLNFLVVVNLDIVR